jgi:adenosylmethionine---8-amino-7-oxononanoate aminotransferase
MEDIEPAETGENQCRLKPTLQTSIAQTCTLSARDKETVWHPFTQMRTARPAIPIVRGEGVYLYAEDGRRYLDAISSWWVNLHGHAHPYIAEKITAQLQSVEHLIFADFTHAPAVDLAGRLLALLPGQMSKIFYSDNGSTAVEVALKMALQYWHNQNLPRRTVISFKRGYHGDTFGAMSAAGKNEFNRPFWSCLFEVEQIDPPLKGMEELALQQLQILLKRTAVACLIFEPLILGSGGMLIYPPEGLERLLRCCRQHGVLTIADEVMTGFGRTGPLFAMQQLQEHPDIICLSKGLTGGFLPLGVTACTQAVYAAFLGEHLQQALLHGHSYTANPLACSSALASLDLLVQPRCSAQRELIAACHRAFCARWSAHPKLQRCESLGTILALEYQAADSSYFHVMRDRLYQFFLDRGLLLRPLGNVLYVMPPYCITQSELETVYAAIAQTLEDKI